MSSDKVFNVDTHTLTVIDSKVISPKIEKGRGGVNDNTAKSSPIITKFFYYENHLSAKLCNNVVTLWM